MTFGSHLSTQAGCGDFQMLSMHLEYVVFWKQSSESEAVPWQMPYIHARFRVDALTQVGIGAMGDCSEAGYCLADAWWCCWESGTYRWY